MPSNVHGGREWLSLEQTAQLFPSGTDGSHISINAVKLWVTSGCRGIVLKTRPAGRRLYTTQEWIDEFMEALDAERTKRQLRKARKSKSVRTDAAETRRVLRRHKV